MRERCNPPAPAPIKTPPPPFALGQARKGGMDKKLIANMGAGHSQWPMIDQASTVAVYIHHQTCLVD